jgi:hypothetical protein
MSKSRRMRWTGHIARMGRRGFWWQNQKEIYLYEDQDVGERIMLKWILEK